MAAAIKRCGSRVAFSLITAKRTCPGSRYFNPEERGISLQRGGKMLETRTRLHAAMPAERSAISKLVRRSLCTPTPLVKKIFLAVKTISVESSSFSVDLVLFEKPEVHRNRNHSWNQTQTNEKA